MLKSDIDISVSGLLQLFRETMEASIIVSVLLALAEQLVQAKDSVNTDIGGDTTAVDTLASSTEPDRTPTEKRLLKKLRVQIFAGAGAGLLIALAM